MAKHSPAFRVIELNPPDCAKSKRKKRVLHKARFDSRRAARNYCRSRIWGTEGLLIRHPDGTEEPFKIRE